MANYLTESTTFGCPFLTGTIKCSDSCHGKVYNKAKILTDGADVSSKEGMCNSPAMAEKHPGTTGPWPCECKLTQWLNTVMNVEISGRHPISSSSSNRCIMGGTVTPKSFFLEPSMVSL